MKLIINILLLAIATPCFAQKKLIDNETPKNWERLEQYEINDNGKYVWYKQRSSARGVKVTLTSSDGKFKKIFDDGSLPTFTEGGKYFICSYRVTDSTQIVDLVTKREYVLTGRTYVIAKSSKGDLIACQSNRQLTVMNLKSEERRTYNDIDRYVFSSDGAYLVLGRRNDSALTFIKTDNYSEHVVNRASDRIWCFDPTNKTFVYLNNDSAGSKLWSYNFADKITRLLYAGSPDKKVTISDEMLKFSPDGGTLYFKIEKSFKDPRANVLTDQLNVWNYRDVYPQSNQLLTRSAGPTGEKQTVAYRISSSRIIPLSNDSLKLLENGKFNNRYILLNNKVNEKEAYYQKKDVKLFILDLETGEMNLIAVNPYSDSPVEITNDERYIIWYDQANHKYVSYDTQSKLKRDLSSSIGYPMDTFEDPKSIRPIHYPYQYSLVRIDDDDMDRLIVSDEFDLWELDFSGNKNPICITKGLGRLLGIQFRVTTFTKRTGANSVFVEALNTSNKNKSVHLLTLNSRLQLKLSEIAPTQASHFSGYFLPQKAGDAEVFLLPLQKVNKSLNLYIYSKRKSLNITDFHQEDDFNWFTSELHTYNLADGGKSEGILYKPENFDPSKKYPVIFYYYELNSSTLNHFIEPNLSQGTLPIPWYVSNGYLVFVPDVTHQQPNPGDRISDCIISAAKYIAQLPYVNAKHMGLQGHSYGGYETNLIITKSDIFAAAQSSAGLSNFTSHYGTPIFGGNPGFNLAEKGQLNMPGTLWEYKDLYLKDSPIFQADRITTPLLMMHGTKDFAVPIAQSIEMYFALRRLNKPVWLLEYEDEEHSLWNENNMLDFTIRQQQFFDHYLKGKPMPVWMSRGVPSWEKGMKSGLELDTTQTSK